MELKPFRLERYFAKYEFTAPHLLCCSDCESLAVGDLLKFEQNAHEELSSLWLGYTESLGSPELRTQIATLYQNISSTQILVHSGAEEAIFNFMNVALATGDHIIVHTPYYQSLGDVARSIGANVTEWKGNPNCAWELDLQFLKENVTERTKVVVVNFPHNPTGYLPNPEFLHELSNLSNKWGFIVFSDEVYRGLEYNSTECLPTFADINERGISLGVMSKSYGLAGLRIGWIATRNKRLFDALAAFKDYTTICNSAPSEYLATLALCHRHSIIGRNLGIIRRNLSMLTSFFSRHQDFFEWHEPKAGPIAFPRYLGGSVEQFCDDLVRHAGVLLLPGTLYDDESDCFRIGFGRSNFTECLLTLEQFLVNYK
ncbi:MAG: aminotransferase class I/II-fold pyridoxal phosphate-dependent enzyme [Desulfuromonadaceae bacterium]|nr:aminotransferase class I/II-fold pyridoxal phosphate-dependent enzyme [Desulfuromonadaceae bacterium]